MQACQLRLCHSLAAFYKAANNLTDPWDNERGWQLTEKQSCERLVGPNPRGQAVYCTWFGLSCCTPALMAKNECWALNTIIALELSINNINVSLANPAVLPSMKALHDCGMRVLNLEANNVAGPISDEWGTLDKLLVFNIGESHFGVNCRVECRVNCT